VVRYIDGDVQTDTGNTWDRVTTTQVPVAPTALLLLAGLPLLARRRKSQAEPEAVAA